MSSEIILVDFLIPLSSPKDLRALVRASLNPFSWLPPLDVGIVLQKLKNSIAASDAFFPFPDGVKKLINAGVKVIIQPGGSMRDKKAIEVANKAKVKMIFTGIRHFNH